MGGSGELRLRGGGRGEAGSGQAQGLPKVGPLLLALPPSTTPVGSYRSISEHSPVCGSVSGSVRYLLLAPFLYGELSKFPKCQPGLKETRITKKKPNDSTQSYEEGLTFVP